ncbi:MAG: IS1595 family transposase [Bacteroidia bacterium]|nr:IS1595 family transposase [Bacteroidia bacterium]MBP7259695.1 IS1595 family transposase [Bacteroidia bacterium]MBP9179392.1 IS1595 family transposase [Bacteroidia bacterium]MBP9723354.1 IS1595 family transposase [Bacteroidia bacterium]
MKDFNNLLELLTYFKDDTVCREYLEAIRWADGIVCPHCGSERFYKLKSGVQYKCASNVCYKKFTVTVGTIFDSAKIPLRKWFVAMYLVTSHKKGISSYQLSRDIGVTQKSAWFMLHRLRELSESGSMEKLKGQVEVDECYIGGQEKNKHKQNKSNKAGPRGIKTPVLAIVERGGAARVLTLQNVKSKSIVNPVYELVEEGTTVITDQFNAYYMLKGGFKHETVNHSKDEFVRGDIHTNTVEGFFSILKRGIYGIYHQVSPKHLQRYCNEFAFRYSTRDMDEGERFNEALGNMNKVLRYNKLINRK